MWHTVNTRTWSGRDVIVLERADGAQATVAPWSGANLIGLALLPEGREYVVPIIDTPPDACALEERPTRYGAPVLAPFPGRIGESRFIYDGSLYQIDPPLDGGVARHGFVLRSHFTKVDEGVEADSVWVSLAFQGQSPDIQRQYPSTFSLVLTFRLDDQGFALSVKMQNTGAHRLPIGFGWHPYFLPLSTQSRRQNCRLHTACRAKWTLGQDMIPTGERVPVTGKFDLRAAPAIGENTYDDLLTDAEGDENGWISASLLDEEAQLKLTISADQSFRNWVIYTPPERRATCLEPYTCVANALKLAEGTQETGLIHLEPEETWQGELRVRLTSFDRG